MYTIILTDATLLAWMYSGDSDTVHSSTSTTFINPFLVYMYLLYIHKITLSPMCILPLAGVSTGEAKVVVAIESEYRSDFAG